MSHAMNICPQLFLSCNNDFDKSGNKKVFHIFAQTHGFSPHTSFSMTLITLSESPSKPESTRKAVFSLPDISAMSSCLRFPPSFRIPKARI